MLATIRPDVADTAVNHTPIRFDRLQNPYAPSAEVRRSVEQGTEWMAGLRGAHGYIQGRVARRYRVDERALLLGAGLEVLVEAVNRMVGKPGMKAAGIAPAADSPDNRPVVFVQSPADPSGKQIGLQQLISLCQSRELVIVDEQHGERASWSALPLVHEFDNLLVLRSFEHWAGLGEWPSAVAFGDPRLVNSLREHLDQPELPELSIAALLATFDDMAYVGATLDRLRMEKHRLYRMLRKSSVVSPTPSAAHFICAEVERGCRSQLAETLTSRGIVAHLPSGDGNENLIRFSASSPLATLQLQDALCAHAQLLNGIHADFRAAR